MRQICPEGMIPGVVKLAMTLHIMGKMSVPENSWEKRIVSTIRASLYDEKFWTYSFCNDCEKMRKSSCYSKMMHFANKLRSMLNEVKSDKLCRRTSVKITQISCTLQWHSRNKPRTSSSQERSTSSLTSEPQNTLNTRDIQYFGKTILRKSQFLQIKSASKMSLITLTKL